MGLRIHNVFGLTTEVRGIQSTEVRYTVLALLISGPKNKYSATGHELLEHAPSIFVVNFDLLPRVRI